MNTKELSRLTVDIPKEAHKRLKALSILREQSMRDMIIEAIQLLDECPRNHIPNKGTVEAIEQTKSRKNLVECSSVEDLFKKLGI